MKKVLCVYEMITFLFLFNWISTIPLTAQVAMGSGNDPIPGAGLDLSQAHDRGLLHPKVQLSTGPADFVLDALTATDSASVVGMLAYNSNANVLNGLGFYVWKGKAWQYVKGGPADRCSEVRDIDGNVYPAVQIGTQCWMAKNLQVSRKSTGVVLEHLLLNPASDGAKCIQVKWENGEVSYKKLNDDPADPVHFTINTTEYTLLPAAYAQKFGCIYFRSEIDNLCPFGWKVPSTGDFAVLATALGADAGKRMKSDGASYIPDVFSSGRSAVEWGGFDATDARNSGFKAFPSGRMDSNDGIGFGIWTQWMTSDVGSASIEYSSDELMISDFDAEMPVRCIKE
ncbi:hypothetical protein FACS189413_06200 [Bacteroidia bacterium]|nr:hypothetical protein FACS189413_06200 [Bacteroidia bacterium]